MPVNCVCPIYRYATFPSYSSYYSKRCVGTSSSFVSFDTLDIGQLPNLNCDSTACDAGCISFVLTGDPNFEAYPVGQTARTILPRGFVLRPESDAELYKSFVAKLNLSGDLSIYVKLFVVLIRRTDTRYFGIGQETEEQDSVVDVNLDIHRIDNYCARFRLKQAGHDKLLPGDIAFQVLTNTPLPATLVPLEADKNVG